MEDEFNEITAVIIDDMESFRCQLIDFLSDFGDIKIVAEASSAKEGYDTILSHQPDLIFLDIQMENDDSGIQLATKIREIPKNLLKQPCIVFMTAYEGHDFPSVVKNNPISFLTKPISEENVLYAISAVKAVLENSDEEEVLTRYMIIEGSNKYFIAPKKDILYIRSLNNSTYIYLEDGREFKTNVNLSHYQALFEAISVCQVGKSFLVNLYKVEAIVAVGNVHKIIIKNHETNISVGKSFYKKIISELKKLQ